MQPGARSPWRAFLFLFLHLTRVSLNRLISIGLIHQEVKWRCYANQSPEPVQSSALRRPHHSLV
jgi:hypothetical protein